MGCAGVVVAMNPHSWATDTMPTFLPMTIPLFPVGWMQCHHPHWLTSLPTAPSLLSQTIAAKDAFHTRVGMGRVGAGSP